MADFLTAFVGGDGDAIANLVTEDAVLHQPRWPQSFEGRRAIVEKTGEVAGTFTDVAVVVEDVVVSGDRVAAYTTASGRNVGPLVVDAEEIAPTGRQFEVPQFGHYRLANGAIAEAWVLADALGIVQQLDNFPAGPAKMLTIMLRQLGWRLGGRRRLD